jgi:cyanophycinase
MAGKTTPGSLALVGGGEFDAACAGFDAKLLAASGGSEVVVLPTAAAFEHADRVAEHAAKYFDGLGATVTTLMVLHRSEAEDEAFVEAARDARFVYIADGSPLHLRSVLKGSSLYAAVVAAYERGAVIAASGAGATLLCDPMVDPRGGAYTVGLGLLSDLAVFPYHGTAADHLRERSVDLLPPAALLAGIDEHTALVRDPEGAWTVDGEGSVRVYGNGDSRLYNAGDQVPLER